MRTESDWLQILRGVAILAALLHPAWSSGQTPSSFEFGRIDVIVDGTNHQLETMTVRPRATGKRPLAVITHGGGSPGARERTPMQMSIVAQELAARGWLSVVVMRRGFGASTGSPGTWPGCGKVDYVTLGMESAKDLRAAVEVLRKRDDVDANTVVIVGQSTGGFAVVALGSRPPEGVRAIINFAGGHGAMRSGEVCQPDDLVSATRTFGETGRLPALWVYTQNDMVFNMDLSRRLHDAYTRAGGKADFVTAPAHGADGHGMAYTRSGPALWTSAVEEFLLRNNLPTSPTASSANETIGGAPPPAGLIEGQRRAWQIYLDAPDHRAFAIAPSGGAGYVTGRRSAEEARTEALRRCNKPDCVVVEQAPTR